MAVIWGLDLHEIQFSKFKSSYMFKNRDYHLRRTKFIIYQCAMIFLVVSESLGTAVLSDYVNQQSRIQRQFPNVRIHNDDYVGIASYNIFVGVMSAIVFGAAFFFDLFLPERYEPRYVQNLWLGGALFCTLAGLGDAIAYTYILAKRGLRVTGSGSYDPRLLRELSKEGSKTPIIYQDSGRAVASLTLLWIGWISAVASTVVMFMFYRHVKKNGTARSAHAITQEKRNEHVLTEHEPTNVNR